MAKAKTKASKQLSTIDLSDPLAVRFDQTGRSPAYFCLKSLVRVDANLVSDLKRAAIQMDDSNIRICLHDSPDAEFHQMINLDHQGRYYRPHKHPTKVESYHIIEGTTAFFVFDEQGNVRDANLLDPHDSFLYRVDRDTYHAVVPLTDLLIYHESKMGPFDRDTANIFPEWAPDGSNPDEAQEYSGHLLSLLQS